MKSLKHEKMAPIPKAEECTIQLFKEMEVIVVIKKNKK